MNKKMFAAAIAVVVLGIGLILSSASAREATHLGCYTDNGNGTVTLEITKLPNRGFTREGAVFINAVGPQVASGINISNTYGPDGLPDTGDEVGSFVTLVLNQAPVEYFRFEWGPRRGEEEFGVARFRACPGQETTTTTEPESTTTTEPEQSTTTTTPESTTTTTEPDVTTTTSEPGTTTTTTEPQASTTTSTTSVESTTTSEPGSTTTTETTTPTDTPRELPHTGSTTNALVVIGLMLVGGGAALLVLSRRPSTI